MILEPGYSMMQQLRRVPATELKIDKSFVQDHAQRSPLPHHGGKNPSKIGHCRRHAVVAEGVETAEQLKTPPRNGCNIAQGNLFSRALPPFELMGWLAVAGRMIDSLVA